MIGYGQVEVGTEATVIVTADVDGQNVTIKNIDDAEVYLGNSDVTTENGFSLEKDEIIDLFLGPGEEIYGVVDDNTGTACYLATLNE